MNKVKSGEMTTIRVLVVDDSPVYRSLLIRLIGGFDETGEVLAVDDGKKALDLLDDFAPQLVLLDLEMPGMGGMEVLGIIKQRRPDTDVVVIGGSSNISSEVTLKAIAAGALDFIWKTSADNPGETDVMLSKRLAPFIRFALSKFERLQRQSEVTDTGPYSESRLAGRLHQPVRGTFDLIVVSASTGAPAALERFIPSLPAEFALPVIVVVKLPPSFNASLVGHLDAVSVLRVKSAEDGEIVKGGVVYVAPGDLHTTVVLEEDGLSLHLSDLPPIDGNRPSLDLLLTSIARGSCGNCLAVMMTGACLDGLTGVEELCAKGTCRCIVQSRSSCVVSGLVDALVASDCVDEEVRLENLADRIVGIVSEGGRSG